MAHLPKLSYVLLSHNREKYIRAAVESALAQDYEGELEYIFSDDCSTDRTFELIKECVAAYKGNRRVVVTQTPANQHLAGNTNHALKFVESDWIVRADDDDLSAVDRCAIIGKAVAEHPEASFVTTGVRMFTDEAEAAALEESHRPAGTHAVVRELDIRRRGYGQPFFCVEEYSYKAWRMDSFRIFGDLDRQAYYCDDYICYFRSCVLGPGLYIDNAPAVFVRNGSGNMCRGGDDNSSGYRDTMRRERFFDEYQNATAAPMRQTYEALLEFAQHLPQDEQPPVLAFLADMQAKIHATETLRSYWRKGTINRVRIARELGMTRPYDMLRCLPMPVFAALLAAIRKFKHPH